MEEQFNETITVFGFYELGYGRGHNLFAICNRRNLTQSEIIKNANYHDI